MRTRTTLIVLVSLLVLSLAVSACGEGSGSNSAAAQAMLDQQRTRDAASAVTPEAEAAPVGDTALTVGDAAFTLADLQALPQATASTDEGDVTGARLTAVLETAGLTADTITLTARDGYSVDVATADLDDTAVLSVDGEQIDVTIPTLPSNTWVDDVVSISAS